MMPRLDALSDGPAVVISVRDKGHDERPRNREALVPARCLYWASSPSSK